MKKEQVKVPLPENLRLLFFFFIHAFNKPSNVFMSGASAAGAAPAAGCAPAAAAVFVFFQQFPCGKHDKSDHQQNGYSISNDH